MKMNNNSNCRKISARSFAVMGRATIAATVLMTSCICTAGAKKVPTGPIDFRKGFDEKNLSKPWTLGAIGARGHFTKRNARQILVASIEKDSPADGVLLDQDVILGVNDLPEAFGSKEGKFTMDAHRALALALEEVEKKNTSNTLSLTVWRPKTKVMTVKEKPNFRKSNMIDKRVVLQPVKAEILNVTLKLPAYGTFSKSSPWKCEKADALVHKMAERISERGFFRASGRSGTGALTKPEQRIDRVMDAIGLLATGDDKYLPQIKKYAHSFVGKGASLDIDKTGAGIGAWAGAFNAIFLAEYYLRTKDAEVLPAVKGYALYLAKGVSGVGTWSHGVAAVHENGMYGPPCAYGAMNQATALCAMSLVLAQKCGIKDPYVDRAVNLSLDYFNYYVDKGCLPYGDHAPVIRHDANGRMSITALFADLAGNKKLADYYTRMTVASHTQREGGHATDIFSWQWGALGAARGGPEAAAAFSASTRYFSELSRNDKGGATYQPMLSGDNMKTGMWSTAGSFLMQHCLPRKATYLTGKGGSCVTPIIGQDLKTLLEYDKFNPKGLSVDQLIDALGSFSVKVREQAASELGLRGEDVKDKLLLLLKSDNRYARYGACQALRYNGQSSPIVFETLISNAETHKDWTLRYFALNAFTHKDKHKYGGERALGKLPVSYGPRLLKMAAVKDAENDPREKIPGLVSRLLFDKGAIYSGKGIVKVNSGLLTPAVAALLQNPNGGTRSTGALPLLTLEEENMEPLWGVLYDAMTNPAPSGVMFGGGVNWRGNAVMAKYHIKEGLPLAIWYTFEKKGWGDHSRKKALPSIAPYGAHLKPHMKVLYTSKRNYSSWRDVKKGIALIEKTPAPKLRSIQKQIDEYRDSKKNSLVE
jgi:hypothetical protein